MIPKVYKQGGAGWWKEAVAMFISGHWNLIMLVSGLNKANIISGHYIFYFGVTSNYVGWWTSNVGFFFCFRTSRPFFWLVLKQRAVCSITFIFLYLYLKSKPCTCFVTKDQGNIDQMFSARVACCLLNSFTAKASNTPCNFDKYNWQLGQIYFMIWTIQARKAVSQQLQPTLDKIAHAWEICIQTENLRLFWLLDLYFSKSLLPREKCDTAQLLYGFYAALKYGSWSEI